MFPQIITTQILFLETKVSLFGLENLEIKLLTKIKGTVYQKQTQLLKLFHNIMRRIVSEIILNQTNIKIVIVMIGSSYFTACHK